MSAVNNNSILPPATPLQQPLSLQECKALYIELQPKGASQIIYTSEQFRRIDSLLNRIKAIPSGQQAFNVYGDWFLRFQAVYIKYCASPSVSQVQSVIKDLVDNGQLDTAMQLAYRFKGSWVDKFRFMTTVASKIASFADVQKIVLSFTQAEQADVWRELGRELSTLNGKQPYHMQFPAADLLRFPGDDAHFDRLTKYYLSISRPDLAKQAFDRIGDESKRDVLLKYTIFVSHPDLIGTVFP